MTDTKLNPSKTASGVAYLRAVHQLLDGDPKILDDRVAAKLIDPEVLDQIQSRPAQAREWVPGLRSHVVLRSRYAEDRMEQAMQRGVRQCVILGAGYDTFAYRQPEWTRGLRIYEVDHAATQQRKRQRLCAANIEIPPNLEFVAIDFERVSLREGLCASALNFSEPAFFSCLGVLVYLSREAADAIFQLVASFPSSSELAFTYSAPAWARSSLSAIANLLGEPWLSHFEPHTLERDLLRLGLSDISFLSREEADRNYFHGRSDGLRAPDRGSIATAFVNHLAA